MSVQRILAAIALVVAAAPATAATAGFDPQRLYLGGGISQNELPGSDEGTGFQFFGGYRFGELAPAINLDAEVGYMNTGDMEVRAGPPPFGGGREVRAKGLWASGLFRFGVGPQADLLARAGFDFGDDDGLLVGVGVGFNLSREFQLRLEYVERDNVDSLQANVTFRP